ASNRREVTGREANRLVAEPVTSRIAWLFCTNFVPPTRERWSFWISCHFVFCSLQKDKTRGKNDPVSGHDLFQQLSGKMFTANYVAGSNARTPSRALPIFFGPSKFYISRAV